MSTSFSSLSFHCNIPASYLNTATAHAFIAVILFFPFSFDFRTNQSLHLYSFIVFSFISFFLILSNSAKPIPISVLKHEQFSQVYPFVLHSWKTASNHLFTINDLACILFPPFIACVYLSRYQQQRYHTQNKQQW